MLNAFLVVIFISSASNAADECSSAGLRSVLHDSNPQVVKTLENQWALAYAKRDAALLNCILAEDFEIGSMPAQGFEIHDRQHVLEWLATRTGSAELEQLQIKPYGPAVVARGVYSVRRDRKLVSRFQFADFFLYREGRWQAVARTLAQLPVQ
jgi:Domain of unknown function (DUF4440)